MNSLELPTPLMPRAAWTSAIKFLPPPKLVSRRKIAATAPGLPVSRVQTLASRLLQAPRGVGMGEETGGVAVFDRTTSPPDHVGQVSRKIGLARRTGANISPRLAEIKDPHARLPVGRFSGLYCANRLYRADADRVLIDLAMDPASHDAQLRQAAFSHVDRLAILRGGVHDAADLAGGFEFDVRRNRTFDPAKEMPTPDRRDGERRRASVDSSRDYA